MAATVTASYEALRGLAPPIALPWEAAGRITAAAVVSWEAVHALQQVVGPPHESLSSSRGPIVVPWEARGAVIATVVVAYEAEGTKLLLCLVDFALLTPGLTQVSVAIPALSAVTLAQPALTDVSLKGCD